MSNSSNSSITALVPGGLVTTQNISTVIRPKGNTNSMQFVKIQTPELSKKAEEQIRVAKESNISKEKIKEVEEEWQNNLLNWKSKRRQQFVGQHEYNNDNNEQNYDPSDNGSGRKIKTFAEMIEQRAKKGNRLNFHLERYIGSGDDEEELQVVTSADTDHSTQLNSTFKEGIEKPPALPLIDSRDGKLKPLLDVDTRTSEVSVRSNDVSDDSASEPEDDEAHEEQEEQKQIQRNAFVAKLKAFERMTQPERQEPKFVPVKPVSRSVKAPKPANVDVTPKVGVDDIPNLTSRVTSIQINREPSDAHIKPTPPQLPRQNQSQQQPLSQIQQKPIQQSQLPSQPTVLQQPPPPQLSQPQPLQPPPPPSQQQISPPPPPLLPVLQQQSDLPKQHQPSPPVTQQSFIPPQIPTAIPNTMGPTRFESIESHANQHKTDHWSEYLPHTPGNEFNNHHNPSTQRIGASNHSIQSQPLPEPPKANSRLQATSNYNNNNINSTQLPRKPVPRDDKDRTVLSVSGKKRCSSCKEELGRGAAAFVVESLSLVYHTNCFRCSVCHVNLSNGFRGVDVRVHAGALHCQNCYSKDGLNYSRV